MTLVKCKALRAFTEFVSGFGMVHGDPDNQSEKARFPEMPEEAAVKLISEGKVEASSLPEFDAATLRTSEGTGKVMTAIEGIADGEHHDADLSQLDHDGDGHPGGSISATGDDIAELRKLYKEVVGKPAFNGWDADALRAKISAAQTGNEGAPI